MSQLTINIEVPAGMAIDLNKLKVAANEFVKKYVGQKCKFAHICE